MNIFQDAETRLTLSPSFSQEIGDKEINDKVSGVLNYEVTSKDEDGVIMKITSVVFNETKRMRS